jgi:hypothetical protein
VLPRVFVVFSSCRSLAVMDAVRVLVQASCQAESRWNRIKNFARKLETLYCLHVVNMHGTQNKKNSVRVFGAILSPIIVCGVLLDWVQKELHIWRILPSVIWRTLFLGTDRCFGGRWFFHRRSLRTYRGYRENDKSSVTSSVLSPDTSLSTLFLNTVSLNVAPVYNMMKKLCF